MILDPEVRFLLLLAFLLLVIGIGLTVRLQFTRFAPLSVGRLSAISLVMAIAAIGVASWATGWTPRDLAGRAPTTSNQLVKVSLDPRTATELKWKRAMPADVAQRYEREATRTDGGNQHRG